MKAIAINSGRTGLTERPIPQLDAVNNVLVRVAYAGICRTDLGIANGTIPSADGIVLGHEFVGTVVGMHHTVLYEGGYPGGKPGCLQVGDVVGANPMAFGVSGRLMCGRDCDGAFAEYIAVPYAALIPLPDCLLSPAGAFLEPLAAALAPLDIDIPHASLVAVVGGSRIAQLMAKVLVVKGCQPILISEDDPLEAHLDEFDYLIETTPRTLGKFVSWTRPGGTIILKSRYYPSVEICVNDIVCKNITLRGVEYGDYHEAARLLADHAIDLADIFGRCYPLEEYQQAFDEAAQPGARKIFFDLCAAS